MTIASGSTPTCSTDTTSTNSNELSDLSTTPTAHLPRPRLPSSFRGHSYPFPIASSASISSSTVTPNTYHQSSQHATTPSPDRDPVPPTATSQKTPSTMTWTTSSSSSSEARHERALYDYRTVAPSMHAYRHLSIFRRFGRLSMTNLLSFQSELSEIEESLRIMDLQPDPLSDEVKAHRTQLTRSLRETLKCYYEALLLQEQVFTALERPRDVDAKILAGLQLAEHTHYLHPHSHHHHRNRLQSDEVLDDLVALGLSGRDSLEKVVGRYIPKLFPGRAPSVEDVRLRSRSSKDIASMFSPFTRRVTRLVIAVVTAALMLGPMVILQFVKSDAWKLACIAGFTVALAVMVALGTRGRGEAIVMIIAAYCAVLVVFVQNDCAGGGCGYSTARGSGGGS